MPPPNPDVRCTEGHHRARKRDRIINMHAKCRDCGCDLVVNPVTRRWRYSGVMG